MRWSGTTFAAGRITLGTRPRVELCDEQDWAVRSASFFSSVIKHVICLWCKRAKNSYNNDKQNVKGQKYYPDKMCQVARLRRAYR